MPMAMGGGIENGELHAGAKVPDPHTRAEEHELEAGRNSIPVELNSLVDQKRVGFLQGIYTYKHPPNYESTRGSHFHLMSSDHGETLELVKGPDR